MAVDPLGIANRHPIISNNRMETIVTETQDEDLNKPATIGTVRMLAVHADAGFAQLHMDRERLSDKVDHLDEKLSQRIDSLETNLSQRIDHLDEKLSQRIDNSVIELKSEMSVNLSKVMDQLALRSNSDRFIKTGFGVAVLGVLIQTVFVALR